MQKQIVGTGDLNHGAAKSMPHPHFLGSVEIAATGFLRFPPLVPDLLLQKAEEIVTREINPHPAPTVGQASD